MKQLVLHRFAIAAATVAAAMLPWLADAYTVSVAAYALILALIAASAHVLLIAGLPSLGQAAYLGLGAYAATWCARDVTTSAPALLAVAVGACVTAAAVIGVALVRTRATLFMILTLMAGELAYTAAAQHGEGLAAPATSLGPDVRLTADGHIYLYCLTVTAIALAGLWRLRSSRTCLIWRGIADNEAHLRTTGHHVENQLWLAYVAAAAAAGVAGALLVTAHRFVGPADMSADISALALLAAIIGGRSAAGAVAAAAVLIVVRDLSGGFLSAHTPLLLGLVFLVAAYLPHRRLQAAP
ncbi:branched-chain amino acid ABC transporter permease [Catellatospora sp. NPDC049111]|uniref:branched-chain amino acid ABC transporter permease n=1 Tax=Catellatospora sp. NPDC049111 TaxID=3155271 RepID=UPI0033C30E71